MLHRRAAQGTQTPRRGEKTQPIFRTIFGAMMLVLVAEILLLTEGSLAPVSCLVPGAPACERLPNCRTYAMWKGLNDMIADYFGKITLADLAAPDQAGNDYII